MAAAPPIARQCRLHAPATDGSCPPLLLAPGWLPSTGTSSSPRRSQRTRGHQGLRPSGRRPGCWGHTGWRRPWTVRARVEEEPGGLEGWRKSAGTGAWRPVSRAQQVLSSAESKDAARLRPKWVFGSTRLGPGVGPWWAWGRVGLGNGQVQPSSVQMRHKLRGARPGLEPDGGSGRVSGCAGTQALASLSALGLTGTLYLRQPAVGGRPLASSKPPGSQPHPGTS